MPAKTKKPENSKLKRSDQKNIVIVGAGFAGLRVALDLAKSINQLSGHKVHLIDKRPHHLYTPLLYEVASGYFAEEIKDCEGLLKAGVCVEVEDLHYLLRNKQVEFHQGAVTKINQKSQTITYNQNKRLKYKYLVLALGAETEFYGIKGLDKNAQTIKSAKEALAIRNKIHATLKNKKKSVRIVVGGGGATGVEFAAELASCFNGMCQRGDLKPSQWQVTLIEGSNRILRVLHPQISKWAEQRLTKLGVDVEVDTVVKSVNSSSVFLGARPLQKGEKRQDLNCRLVNEGKKKIDYDILVWTGGIRGHHLLAQSKLPVNTRGYAEINVNMLIKSSANIFALGDNASLIDPKTKRPVPALAQAAMKEAKIVSHNIKSKVKRQKIIAYNFKNYPAVIPLGGKYALAQIGALRIKGWPAYLLRKFIDLKYFVSILPLPVALKVWWHGAKVYIKND